MKVECFETKYPTDLQDQINAFLKKNPDINITDKMQTASGDYTQVSIWYEETKQDKNH